jgi:cysteinyl-tRNA synthetase
MSKSKGEFLTVSLLKEKGYDPLVYRYFCMQSHYRKNLVFTWENLDNAKVAYGKLVARVAQLKAEGEIEPDKFEAGKRRFTDALDNDLNTSLAVTALYDVFKLDATDATKLALIKDFERVLSLGLIEAAAKYNEEKNAPAEDAVDPELRAYIEERIEARRAAKAAKNYAEADAIRAELTARGVTLIDTKEGTRFTVAQ